MLHPDQEVEFKPDHEAQVRGLGAIINSRETGDILIVRQSGKIIAMVNILYTISCTLRKSTSPCTVHKGNRRIVTHISTALPL